MIRAGVAATAPHRLQLMLPRAFLYGVAVIRGILLLLVTMATAQAAWFDNTWKYRVPVNVPASATLNSTIKVDVDFGALLSTLGVAGTFDANSPRIVRPNDALATYQEFTDSVYTGATDATGNSRGEVRFILQDAGPATYYIYFDIVANGPKAANPQTPINGNFERGMTGTEDPIGWSATKAGNSFDAQVRPSESPSITSDGSSPAPYPNPVITDGTPYTGAYSYLIGARTNNEAVSSDPSVTLSRSIVVPSVSPGNLTIRYRLEGWDSSDNGETQYDFLRIALVGSTTTEIVGPTAGNYTTYPFSPNKGANAITNKLSGYGRYNYWDIDTANTHNSGMTLAAGSQPWFTRTYSLASYAGQTITLRIRYAEVISFKSWVHIDDVEWSVVVATLGAPETGVLAPGGFNAYDISTLPATAITGVLKTKIAAQTFSFDVMALNAAKSAMETGFAGVVKVELLNSSDNSGAIDANGCRSSWTILQTLANQTFAAGDAAVTGSTGRHRVTGVTENNVWKNVRIRISYPATGSPTAVGCSSDNFAIRPASFTGLTIKHLDWENAGTGAVTDTDLGNLSLALTGSTSVHKAGRNFYIAATAVNAASGTTTNYVDTPTAALTSCSAGATCTGLGANCACTATTGSVTLPGNAVSGTYSSIAATYDEAGAFNIQLLDSSFAVVDAADTSGDCTSTGRYVCSSTVEVGRFVPDHFAVVKNAPAFAAACPAGSFTYVGQPFTYATQPLLTMTAEKYGGGTTSLYVGSLWRITVASVSQSYSALTGIIEPVTGAWPLPVVTSVGAGSGTISYSAGPIATSGARFRRTSPEAPFDAEIALGTSIVDADAVTTAGAVSFGTAAAGNGIAFDTAKSMRFGRLQIANVFGPASGSLSMPVQAQYWSGKSWVLNGDDSCTTLPANTIFLTGGLAATTTASAASLTGGVGSLVLTKSTTATGSVDVAANLGTTGPDQSCLASHGGTASNRPWLRSRNGSCAATYDRDPSARATFGIYAPETRRTVHVRELF